MLCLSGLLLTGCTHPSFPNEIPDGREETTMNEKKTDERQMNTVTVSSGAIGSMIEAFASAGLSMHSVLVMRHGEIVAEGYAPPFDENTLHRMYSVSKSFCSVAIGQLTADPRYRDRIGLDTRIGDLDCFSDYIKPETDRRITDTTVRDLLRMASPFPKGSTYDGPNDMDWLATFFDPADGRKPDHEPGTVFHYDTSASYLRGVIVEKMTGMTFLEYLKQTALNEIGFSEQAWCVKSPEGYAWAGSGVMCTTRDLANFAYLVMREGNLNGKQLLPADYLRAATSHQINITEKDDENSTGYGYQIWITDFGFAFLGMGSQFAFCVPSMDLVFVCTADNQGYKRDGKDAESTIFSIFRQYLLSNITQGTVTEPASERIKLDELLSGMQIPAQTGYTTVRNAQEISGKTFVGNGAAFSSFSLTFSGESGVLSYSTARGDKELCFGLNQNRIGLLDEPGYSGDAINHPNGKGYRALCSGAWTADHTFVLWVQVCDDYFGNMKMTFDFSGNTAAVEITKTAEWFLDEYKMKKAIYVQVTG